MKGHEINTANIAASFQKCVVDILVHKTIHYALENNITKVAIAGGVASNSGLRNTLLKKANDIGLTLYYPNPLLCTDNAAMIGSIAYYEYLKGTRANMSLNAVPNLAIGGRL